MLDKLISQGDDVIIYANYKQTYVITITPGQQFQSKFGSLNHEELLGRRFGSKVQCSRGYVYVLKPTPELYSANIRHRTQILYPHDVSLILCQLEGKPGSVLLEAGTGSGSFTRAAQRAVGPMGRIHTFETNAERYRLACQDFKATPSILLYNRNVCVEGFGLVDTADAVFLDLPAPWDTVAFACCALKRDSTCRFGSFSPCIEQTQKTCEKLSQHGFTEILTVECVPKQYKVVDLATCQRGKGLPVAPKRCKKSLDDKDVVSCLENQSMNSSKNDQSIERAQSTNQSYLSFVPDPLEQPTHTGYLTFATLLPRN